MLNSKIKRVSWTEKFSNCIKQKQRERECDEHDWANPCRIEDEREHLKRHKDKDYPMPPIGPSNIIMGDDYSFYAGKFEIQCRKCGKRKMVSLEIFEQINKHKPYTKEGKV